MLSSAKKDYIIICGDSNVDEQSGTTIQTYLTTQMRSLPWPRPFIILYYGLGGSKMKDLNAHLMSGGRNIHERIFPGANSITVIIQGFTNDYVSDGDTEEEAEATCNNIVSTWRGYGFKVWPCTPVPWTYTGTEPHPYATLYRDQFVANWEANGWDRLIDIWPTLGTYALNGSFVELGIDYGNFNQAEDPAFIHLDDNADPDNGRSKVAQAYFWALFDEYVYKPSTQDDLVFDLDARYVTLDTLAELTVSEFTDLSGNGNVATQTLKERQPVWLQDEINGHPAVQADTSAKYMSFLTAGALASLRNKSQATLIVVAKWTGSASNVQIFTMTETSATSGRLAMQRTATAERAVARNTAGAVTPSGGTPDTGNYMRLAITVNFGTTTVKGYQNGVEIYSATPSAGNFTDTDAGVMRLFTNGDNSVNSQGYLLRCVLYDRALSADELAYHEFGLAALMGA